MKRGKKQKAKATTPNKSYSLSSANLELDGIRDGDMRKTERHYGWERCGGGFRKMLK